MGAEVVAKFGTTYAIDSYFKTCTTEPPRFSGSIRGTAKMATVAVLAASRQKLMDVFNGRIIDDDAVDIPEFENINAVETEIVNASFKSRTAYRAGKKILMEDKPSHWDDFQQRLFLQMIRFA